MTNSGSVQKSADAFRTISEVAVALNLPQHVLRFWETRFVQIKPLKRGGGRRFYRPEDVELLAAIRKLLYGEGYTIKGVQRILKEQGPRAVAALARQGRPAGERPLPMAVSAAHDAEQDDASEHDGLDTDHDDEEAPSADDLDEFSDSAPVAPVVQAKAPEPRFDPGGLAPPTSTNEAMGRLRAVIGELADCRRVLLEAEAEARRTEP